MKTLDIEKIKAALSYHAYVPSTASSRPQKHHERLAVEALASLEAYDPDVIRRECAEAAGKWHDLVYPGDGPIQDTLIKAIMSAGKE